MIEDLATDLLNGFLQLVLDFVIFIVNLILLPFDLLIDTFFPDFSNLVSNISLALNEALNYIGWVIDSVGINNVTLILVVDYLIFKLTIPLQAYVVKIAISWYNKLKV